MNSIKRRDELVFALQKNIPTMVSYLFLGMAFGILLDDAGRGMGWSFFTSLTVYAGALQMALAGFLKEGAPIATILFAAFAMNSRHIFYGVSFIEEFKKHGRHYLYMIFSLTDETYALLCSTEIPEHFDRQKTQFYIAHFAHLYWITGSVAGALVGRYVPFDFEGIDFCMTALFIVIFVEQWLKADSHVPATAGLAASVVFLVWMGPSRFILPAMLLSTAVVLLTSTRGSSGGRSQEVQS